MNLSAVVPGPRQRLKELIERPLAMIKKGSPKPDSVQLRDYALVVAMWFFFLALLFGVSSSAPGQKPRSNSSPTPLNSPVPPPPQPAPTIREKTWSEHFLENPEVLLGAVIICLVPIIPLVFTIYKLRRRRLARFRSPMRKDQALHSVWDELASVSSKPAAATPDLNLSVSRVSKESATTTPSEKLMSPAIGSLAISAAPAVDLLSLQHDVDKVKKEMLSLTVLLGRQSHQTSAVEERSLQALAKIEARCDENASRLSALEDQIQRVLDHVEVGLHEQIKTTEQQLVQKEEIDEIRAGSLRLTTEIAEVRAELANLAHGNSHTAEPDSFYARTLGVILSQNIEALQAGDFEQMSKQVGERLNQFFQLEVPHGATLLSLRQRVEGISVALKEVVAQMARLNADAAAEAIPHLQRAEALASEVGRLQSQLQDRRTTIEATLRVPVSIHAGARQTFLNELGRGIRREVDKLSDPLSHFARELNQLIANDIISVVDVCDTIIAHPGTHPELETALSSLFTNAGLRIILPRQGDLFKASDHEMIRAVASGPSKSKSIAQVMRRGFNHVRPEGETLLRRAGVVVYR